MTIVTITCKQGQHTFIVVGEIAYSIIEKCEKCGHTRSIPQPEFDQPIKQNEMADF